MNLHDAIGLMITGNKIKLPEWTGYWFIPENVQVDAGDASKSVRVLTKDGELLDKPWFDKYKDRTDFEVTEGKMGFDFGIRALKNGMKVARAGWNGKGMWLQLQVPDAHSKMGHPYAYMKGVDGKLFPWNPNALDLFADDWGLVE